MRNTCFYKSITVIFVFLLVTGFAAAESNALEIFGDVELNQGSIVADSFTVWDGDQQRINPDGLEDIGSEQIDETEDFNWQGNHKYYENIELQDRGIGSLLFNQTSYIQLAGEEGVRIYSYEEGEKAFITHEGGGITIAELDESGMNIGSDASISFQENGASLEFEYMDEGNITLEKSAGSGTSPGILMEESNFFLDEGTEMFFGNPSLEETFYSIYYGNDDTLTFREDGEIAFEIVKGQDLEFRQDLKAVDGNGENPVTIWDAASEYVPLSSLEDNSFTVNTGDLLSEIGEISLGDTVSLSIDLQQMAGNALEESGGSLGVEENSIGNAEIDQEDDYTVSSVNMTDVLKLEQTDYTCETSESGVVYRDTDNNLQYCKDGSSQQLN